MGLLGDILMVTVVGLLLILIPIISAISAIITVTWIFGVITNPGYWFWNMGAIPFSANWELLVAAPLLVIPTFFLWLGFVAASFRKIRD